MRLNHITLIVSNLDASRTFYERRGLKPIVLEKSRYARFVFPDGDETLSLEVTGEEPTDCRAQIYLECEDLDNVCSQLSSAGLRFHSDPTDINYRWREARL